MKSGGKRRIVRILAALLALVILWPVVERIRGELALARIGRELRARGGKFIEAVDEPAISAPTNALWLRPEVFEARFHPFQAALRRFGPWSPLVETEPGRAIPGWKLKPEAGGVPPESIERWIDWGKLAALRSELTNSPIRMRIPPAPIITNYLGCAVEYIPAHISAVETAENGVRFLAGMACLAARRGWCDGAIENLRAGAALVEIIQSRATAWDQVKGAEAQMRWAEGVWAALAGGGWTDARLAELQDMLHAVGFPAAMAQAVRSELPRMIEGFPDEATPMSLRQCLRAPPPDVLERYAGLARRVPFLGRNAREWLAASLGLIQYYRSVLLWRWVHWPMDKARLLEDALRKSDAGEVLAAGEPPNPEILEPWQEPDSPASLRYVVSDAWFRLMGMVWREALLARTCVALAETAVGLERYRLRHGRYPESLEALVPEFLEAVPRDWMDGRPLRYRLEGPDRFRLWSVGENRIDDGGDPTGSGSQTDWLRGKDLVWPEAVEPPPGR